MTAADYKILLGLQILLFTLPDLWIITPGRC